MGIMVLVCLVSDKKDGVRMIHVNFIDDTQGDLVDVQYFCSGECYTLVTGNDYYGHGWPCGSETDYNVYCAEDSCQQLLWHGLNS